MDYTDCLGFTILAGILYFDSNGTQQQKVEVCAFDALYIISARIGRVIRNHTSDLVKAQKNKACLETAFENDEQLATRLLAPARDGIQNPCPIDCVATSPDTDEVLLRTGMVHCLATRTAMERQDAELRRTYHEFLNSEASPQSLQGFLEAFDDRNEAIVAHTDILVSWRDALWDLQAQAFSTDREMDVRTLEREIERLMALTAVRGRLYAFLNHIAKAWFYDMLQDDESGQRGRLSGVKLDAQG